MTQNSALPKTNILSEEQVEHLYNGVSITAASRDSRHIPSLSRALACKINETRDQLTLILSKSDSTHFLRDISQSGEIAAVFSRPSSHHTIQIKGNDAHEKPFDVNDLEFLKQSREKFATDLLIIDFSNEYSHCLTSFNLDELVTVVFSPSHIFDQTPGFNAGNPLTFAP